MSLHIPHCLDTGAGSPLLLLHAFPMDHSMWDSQLLDVADARLIRPDAPGFGFSPPAPSGWRIADYAGSVLALADSLGLQRFALGGLSMGGYAAFEIYRQAPDRVEALILADTRARDDSPEERQGRLEMAAAIEREGVAVVPGRMLPRLLRHEPDPELVASLRARIMRVRAGSIIHALEALRERRDSTDLLEKISCPALVIAGTEDAITTVAESRDWARMIRNARFVEIPHAGHLSNMENPAAFSKAVTEFLEAL